MGWLLFLGSIVLNLLDGPVVDDLPCNDFDEFQIATSAKGRGVLRLILYERRINLIAIPALCIQIFITAVPSKSRPHMLCVFLKLLTIIVATNRSVAEPAVALGRYVCRYHNHNTSTW